MAGELISDARLVELTERLETTNAGQPISFFEITAVLALTAFAETPADLLQTLRTWKPIPTPKIITPDRT